ncbi:MAG: hypothetical protein GWO11_08970 [Desulfuromonadales bacterium]|nr:hypothetical protein [Desulfuromonadales bacterium]NIR34418.1 hypothetical protein [Desulfuromonadales bacterium]NIS44426.1 hypothetical protein [Desulfuromonadales bacterium]
MKNSFLLIVLIVLLLIGMALTLWLGRGSRHGYGGPIAPPDYPGPLSTG